jgi:UDP-glucose 4-epimerase
MKIMITGSGGFVGGSLGCFAARAGHDVLGLARRSQPNRDWPGKHVSVDVAQADLSVIIKDFAPHVIFHGAGTASVAGSISAPLDDLRASAITWANVLDATRRSGLRPLLIFPSSAAVYGNPEILPVAEESSVAPISPYGFHKAACELLAREYAKCFGLPIVVCRIFSLFGSAQRRLLVWELFDQMAGDAPTVWLQGDGEETRDYLHIDELSSAILHIAQRHEAGASSKPSEVVTVNLASGRESRALDLAELILAQVGVDKEIRCRGIARPGDPKRWQADTTRLQNLAPTWHPRPLAESLAQCIQAWRAAARG